MAKVEFCAVTKSYAKVRVIEPLDLQVGSGEFLALVGPSGCGKSTLLRMVAGLEETTSGEIRIDSAVVNELAPQDRGIAMVFQNYALYPHMTIAQNLEFPLKMAKLSRNERIERISEVAETLGLNELLKRLPSQLSGGQKQRVAMGRAMVRRPKVLLFDEPLSNLDAQLRGKVRAEIAQLHKRSKATIIYVTHDQVEAMTLADRIAILNKGHLEQLGSPMQVYEGPDTHFVASFIGTPPMNFIEKNHFSSLNLPSEAQTIGIRPNELKIQFSEQKSSIAGRISLIEPLGATTYFHIDIDGDVAVVESREHFSLKLDQPVWLGFSPDKLYCFNKQGRRIPFIASSAVL